MSQSSPPPDPRNSAGPSRASRFSRVFWLTFLVVSLGFAWYSFYAPPNDIAWADSYDSAQAQAVASGRPMILYFTGTWCSPCRIMRRQVWADEHVMRLVNAEFVPLAIDVDDPQNADVLARYRVVGPPVTIVTDADGNALDWRAGGIGKAEFLELVDMER